MSCKAHPIDAAAFSVGGRTALAKKLGVTAAAIGNWKVRGTPVRYCVEIEAISNGATTRKDLRPDDWAQIWPELVTAQGAALAAPHISKS